MNSITNDKELWRTIKPLLGEKVRLKLKDHLLKTVNFFRIIKRLQKHLLAFLKNVINKLGVNKDDAKFHDELVILTNRVDTAIQKFENRLSVQLIRDNFTFSDMLQFGNVLFDDILKEFTDLNIFKNGTFKKSSTSCLKEVLDICKSILTEIWSNKIINRKSSPANMKLVDVTPVFPKIGSSSAENYTPIKSITYYLHRCFSNSCKNSLTII